MIKKTKLIFLNDISHWIIKNNYINKSKDYFRINVKDLKIDEEIMKNIDDNIKKRTYNTIFDIVKEDKDSFEYLLIKLFKKNKKKINELINKSKFTLNDFERIENLLLNNSFIYFLKKNNIDILELKFKENIKLFIIFINTLIFNKEYDKAFSLIKTYKLEKYLEIEMNNDFEVKENLIELNDKFGALDILVNNKKEDEYLLLEKDFEFNFNNDFYFIDNLEIFNKLKSLLKESKLWSFDAEFCINYISGQDIIPSILQITNENKKIFIIDLLSKEIVNEFWNFLNKILEDDLVLKLGFSIKDDFEIIGKYFNYNLNIRNIIEVPDIYNSLTGNNLQSLQKIIQNEYKKNFSKFEQAINWQSRPLRKSQIHYACLDSYILIEIYNKLEKNFVFEIIEFTDNYNVNL